MVFVTETTWVVATPFPFVGPVFWVMVPCREMVRLTGAVLVAQASSSMEYSTRTRRVAGLCPGLIGDCGKPT